MLVGGSQHSVLPGQPHRVGFRAEAASKLAWAAVRQAMMLAGGAQHIVI